MSDGHDRLTRILEGDHTHPTSHLCHVGVLKLPHDLECERCDADALFAIAFHLSDREGLVYEPGATRDIEAYLCLRCTLSLMVLGVECGISSDDL